MPPCLFFFFAEQFARTRFVFASAEKPPDVAPVGENHDKPVNRDGGDEKRQRARRDDCRVENKAYDVLHQQRRCEKQGEHAHIVPDEQQHQPYRQKNRRPKRIEHDKRAYRGGETLAALETQKQDQDKE